MSTEGGEYRLNIKNAICLTAAVAVLVIIAMVYRAEHTEAVNIEIDNSISLSANRFGEVINLYTYNDADPSFIYADFERMNYHDAVAQILSSGVSSGSYEKGSRISAEIWVEKSSVNDRYNIIERNIKDAAQQASMKAQCSQMDSGIVRTAEEYGISVGKYRMICELQKLDNSIRMEEYRDYSLKLLRTIYTMMKSGISKDAAENSSGAYRNRFTDTIHRILFESSKSE